MKRIISFAALLLLVTVVGCGKEEKKEVDKAELPATLLLKERPAEVTTLPESFGKVKAGEEITIMGLVGGATKPFVDNRASFTITNKIGKKACCSNKACNTSEGIPANIQVLDKDGKVIKKSLEGFNGLKAGDNVIIKGKVGNATTDNNLQIDATGIYIGK